MQLTCPHCKFSKQVPNDRLPSTPTQVTCPQCRKRFPLPTQKTKSPEASIINCPACHQAQTATEVCSSCGLIFAKFRAPQSAPSVATASANSA
ncbi:MAG: zinc-ribbon domain-containing protein, partial [Geopsychrobacter sp.]|nr:zinc-ribbon domain-containing protein [Geopsychrobacter sp.]